MNRVTGPTSPHWLITCEHGGNDVPAAYAVHFQSAHAKRCLNSHRGYDPGALDAAKRFAVALDAPLISSTTTRLLVDLNRSESSSDVISEFARVLSDGQRESLIRRFHRPYRQKVIDHLDAVIKPNERIIHLSIHTFVPRFRGQLRQVDVGILYDPARSHEAVFCERWISKLQMANRRWRVSANEPYAGTDDGLTTTCRGLFDAEQYLGIEVEINHRYHKRSRTGVERITDRLIHGLASPSMGAPLSPAASYQEDSRQ
ncbi:N-formylglutamate amidohydrolase [Neorhodopirellula pilleata]|uniref:N-formylglutamate amidohydrolase n=1 Tax=Neorhodopirellula pilleata TaxID=2714738 RepID=UPI0011B7A511|nr:N-formylglutamate amidohydrolase [Neorhodopirellula pilleata]